MLYSTNYKSPVGDMLIVSDGKAIKGIWFDGQKHFKSTVESELTVNDELIIFEKVKKWLDDYFNGINPEIDFKLKPEGT